jgi:hypothetical protein
MTMRPAAGLFKTLDPLPLKYFVVCRSIIGDCIVDGDCGLLAVVAPPVSVVERRRSDAAGRHIRGCRSAGECGQSTSVG